MGWIDSSRLDDGIRVVTWPSAEVARVSSNLTAAAYSWFSTCSTTSGEARLKLTSLCTRGAWSAFHQWLKWRNPGMILRTTTQASRMRPVRTMTTRQGPAINQETSRTPGRSPRRSSCGLWKSYVNNYDRNEKRWCKWRRNGWCTNWRRWRPRQRYRGTHPNRDRRKVKAGFPRRRVKVNNKVKAVRGGGIRRYINKKSPRRETIKNRRTVNDLRALNELSEVADLELADWGLSNIPSDESEPEEDQDSVLLLGDSIPNYITEIRGLKNHCLRGANIGKIADFLTFMVPEYRVKLQARVNYHSTCRHQQRGSGKQCHPNCSFKCC